MTKSEYLALSAAVASAAIAAGAFVCAKRLTEYVERQHQRRQVEGFVKKIFGDSDRVQTVLDKLSDDDVASLLRVSDKMRSLKDKCQRICRIGSRARHGSH